MRTTVLPPAEPLCGRKHTDCATKVQLVWWQFRQKAKNIHSDSVSGCIANSWWLKNESESVCIERRRGKLADTSRAIGFTPAADIGVSFHRSNLPSDHRAGVINVAESATKFARSKEQLCWRAE